MYEVGTDRKKQSTKGGEGEWAEDVVTYTTRFPSTVVDFANLKNANHYLKC